MMGRPLKVLIVEDSEPDARLAIHALRQGGFDVTHRRVDSAKGLLAALAEDSWDVILCDCQLPGFGAPEAIRIVRDSAVGIPVIILSGTIGEESVADLMNLGVRDVILKQSLLRLPPAVSRVLQEAASERKRMLVETALRESEARFKAFVAHSPSSITIKDLQLRYLVFGKEERTSLGDVDPSDAFGRKAIGKTAHDFFPKDLADAFTAHDREVLERMQAIGREYTSVVAGEQRAHHSLKFPILDEEGHVIAIGGIAEDITERRQAEAQLRQAQKMEAVGQLTGGIAHDFNNLLTIILGNLQLLERSLGDDGRSKKRVDAAIGAVRRGADLTKRLLAFARRQVLEPKVLDMNGVLGGIEDMLRRTLGEDMALEFGFAPDLWPARVDAGELEHALVNLASNARDAMPRGGQLTIETANAVLGEAYARQHAEVTPGEYAMVAVTDTGCGIPIELQERIFEPFFTTKEKGKGTGLGLAMVYGFVKQSGGHAKIYSELGHGTTMKLYFPRAKAGESSVAEPGKAGEPLSSGRETILLVEDEAAVREIAVTVLVDLGYRVLAAADGPEALELLANNPEVHLLFTDVVMPGGMSGGDLARVAGVRFPKLKVLFCSGYAQEGLARSGRVGVGAQLIMKPYDLADLAKKVRTILDS